MPMKLFNEPSSLRKKLTYYPLCWLGIGLVITFCVTAAFIKTALDSYLMAQAQGYTRQIAKDITGIIDQDKETLSAFILSDTMRNLADGKRLTIALERLLSQNQNFLEGYILDDAGKTIAGASRLAAPQWHGGLTAWNRSIYQEAKAGRIGVSGWENFTQKYLPFWHMAVPIVKYPGKVIAVLLVTIDLRRIGDTILTSEAAKYGDPLLIDRQGRVLVHLDGSKLGTRWEMKQLIRRVLDGRPGTARYSDGRGQFLLAAYQGLRPYGWGLVVQVPPGQTVYWIRNKVIGLLGLMTVITFIFTGILTYGATGKVVAPLRKLTETTRRFGRGYPVEYDPIQGKDELAQLSLAFNQMAHDLAQLEKQRAQYIAMIAHDLRNPLTTIRSIFQSLQINQLNHAERQALVQTVCGKMEQVSRMLADLLEFSRLDLGQIDFQPEAVSVYYLCQDVVAGYLERRYRLFLRTFPEDICVWADPVRFQQVVQNILDNCLKYTASDVPVTIDCRATAPMVQITIADSGCGIAEERLGHFFQPFQSNPAQKEDSFGLGMAIAKKLTIAMGGDLSVESQLNIGTTFNITLPGVSAGSGSDTSSE